MADRVLLEKGCMRKCKKEYGDCGRFEGQSDAGEKSWQGMEIHKQFGGGEKAALQAQNGINVNGSADGFECSPFSYIDKAK